MATGSGIEWTEATWNPLTGCTKVSPGCKHCYAERLSKRLQAMGSPKYANGFQLTLHESALDLPLRWRSPRKIFVNSMSDLFHDSAPTEYILRTFDVMVRANWHQFQVLTKRPERVVALDALLPWRPNIWMGVSVESDAYTNRVSLLRQTHAMTKFLSLEPMLGPLPSLDLEGIDWVIVGGESGPGARPLAEEWVIDVRDQCMSKGVPFFFKQWGGVQKHRTGRLLQGQLWDQMPRIGVDGEVRGSSHRTSPSEHCRSD